MLRTDNRVEADCGRTLTMRELSKRTAQVIDDINTRGVEALLTKHGRPIALITPLQMANVESIVLSRSPLADALQKRIDAHPLKTYSSDEVAERIRLRYGTASDQGAAESSTGTEMQATVVLRTMRELSQRTAQVIDDINNNGAPALLTKHGRPIALITPLRGAEVESIVLSRSPLADVLGERINDENQRQYSSEEVAEQIRWHYGSDADDEPAQARLWPASGGSS